MPKQSSSGRHGGGHQARQRGATASSRKQAARDANARIALARGRGSTDGNRKKPSGRG